MMIYLVDVRVITLSKNGELVDKTRNYVIEASSRTHAGNKIDRLIESYDLPPNPKSIVQVLRIRQVLLNLDGIGEIT